MIGNDIVDLNNIATNWNRLRFFNKVFTEDERRVILISDDKHQTVWLLWSMKEAAYKVHVQQFGTRFFNPKKMVCHVSSSTKGYVTIENEVYYTTYTISNNYIYTIATLNVSETHKSFILEIANTSYFAQSESLKQQVLKTISSERNLNIQDLNLKKEASGIPELFHNNSKLPIKLSLTHCGNYGGFVYF